MLPTTRVRTSAGIPSRGWRPARSVSKASINVENPLLRSGLALAGANLTHDLHDDGILTARDAEAERSAASVLLGQLHPVRRVGQPRRQTLETFSNKTYAKTK